MSAPHSTVAELRHALGRWCVDSPDGLYAAPQSVRELQGVLAVLSAHRVALGREVQLSRGAFDRLESVDPKSCLAQVGAGLKLSELEQKLKAHALTLGSQSPAALDLTVGDFLEGPYAGLRAVPVGRLEPLAAAMQAVLADGSLLQTHLSPRSAAGPDLNSLVLGAHGRIGLVVSAHLRCLPLPETTRSPRLSFPSTQAALEAVRVLLADGGTPWRTRLKKVAERTLAEIELRGAVDQVSRDEHCLMARAPALGGRAAGAALEPPAPAEEHECSWQAIARALETGRTLDLYRLSLSSAVACGGAFGLPLQRPSKWAHGIGLAAAVLGGAP